MWRTLRQRSYAVVTEGEALSPPVIFDSIQTLFENPLSNPSLEPYLKKPTTNRSHKSHYEIPWHLVATEDISVPSPILHASHVLRTHCEAVLSALREVSPPTEKAWGTLHSSVLRMWYYERGGDCREHTDPGLVTALLGGSRPGLEVWDAVDKEWKPCGGGDDGIIVLVGQTTHVVTGLQVPSALHRVVIPPPGEEEEDHPPRVNLILELRPTHPMWTHRMDEASVAKLLC